MDPERDLLFLVLTSHGDPEGVGVEAQGQTSLITPIELRTMLRESGARLSVVIVSACYSGVFADAMAEPDTLVITAADDDHASFGCRDGAKWTSFGEAFFNDALTQDQVAARRVRAGARPASPSASRRKASTRPIRRWPAGGACWSCSAISAAAAIARIAADLS